MRILMLTLACWMLVPQLGFASNDNTHMASECYATGDSGYFCDWVIRLKASSGPETYTLYKACVATGPSKDADQDCDVLIKSIGAFEANHTCQVNWNSVELALRAGKGWVTSYESCADRVYNEFLKK